jgi:hypothetical protein
VSCGDEELQNRDAPSLRSELARAAYHSLEYLRL